MIKRNETLTSLTSEAPFGAPGTAVRTPLLQPEEFFGKGRVFNRMRLPVGSGIGSHVHEGEQEIYYILSGKGEYDNNGVKVEVGPGDLTLCPDGEQHGIQNIGDTDLEFIALILYVD